MPMIIEESPSLRADLEGRLQKIYGQAVKLAAIETGAIERAPVPEKCPWSLEELLEKTDPKSPKI